MVPAGRFGEKVADFVAFVAVANNGIRGIGCYLAQISMCTKIHSGCTEGVLGAHATPTDGQKLLKVSARYVIRRGSDGRRSQISAPSGGLHSTQRPQPRAQEPGRAGAHTSSRSVTLRPMAMLTLVNSVGTLDV